MEHVIRGRGLSKYAVPETKVINRTALAQTKVKSIIGVSGGANLYLSVPILDRQFGESVGEDAITILSGMLEISKLGDVWIRCAFNCVRRLIRVSHQYLRTTLVAGDEFSPD